MVGGPVLMNRVGLIEIKTDQRMSTYPYLFKDIWRKK